MDIIREGDIIIIELYGRIDLETHIKIENELDSDTNWKNIVIDLKHVKYFSSAGLKILLTAKKRVFKKNGNLKISGGSRNVLKVIEIADLIEHFDFYDSLEVALNSF